MNHKLKKKQCLALKEANFKLWKRDYTWEGWSDVSQNSSSLSVSLVTWSPDTGGLFLFLSRLPLLSRSFDSKGGFSLLG